MGPFRIDSLTIEGFKAFATQQTIGMGGKHLFLFGENGRGKSSVLEAIGWCIWGGERETLLRNAFYEGDCEVELTLRAPDGEWRLHRRMRLGTNRSDVDLWDPTNAKRRLEEVFPALPRITGEGTYIILAEQQAHGRAFVDIERFGDMLYAYLGLIEYKKFLEDCTFLLEEYHKVKEGLDAEATKIRQQLNESLQRVNTELAALLSRPSWGQDAPPTEAETIQEIEALGSEVGVSQPLPLKSPHIALQRVGDRLKEQRSIAEIESE